MADRDGGGTMDRIELSVALVQVGVWLHPKEVTILIRILIVAFPPPGCGSGEIDESEFIKFWNTVEDLDQGNPLFIYIYMCVCVYIYMYITHTHTHTHTSWWIWTRSSSCLSGMLV